MAHPSARGSGTFDKRIMPMDTALVISPKGWDNLAQGNALGNHTPTKSSLKGWNN
ncbi:MAG TPA: hypothetical protein VG097_00170 [Gemmata sp.]|jgi:hypothetical protein|nr:hypothetical protein [Gemmata sp.]